MQQEWWRSFGEIYLRGGEVERLDSEAEVEAEAAWKLLDLEAGARIVDAPCGFGRHAVRLGAWGFEVRGIDVDPALLDEARRRAGAVGVDTVLEEGDLRSLPVPDAWADAVLNLASSVGLFASEADNAAVFDEAYRVLRPGGRMLVETSHRDSVVTAGTGSDWSERPDGTLVLRQRRFEPVEGRLLQQFTIVSPDGERLDRHLRPRRYALTELAAMMSASGFVDVEFHGGWRREPVSLTDRVVVVAKQPHST